MIYYTLNKHNNIVTVLFFLFFKVCKHMKSVHLKSFILISILLYFNTYNYGSEKPLSNYYTCKGIITYEGLKLISSLILYQLNYLFHILWYKIFKPTEKELYEAIGNKNSIATQIIFTYPNISPNIQDEYGYSPLYEACSNDNIEVIDFLLADQRTDPNKKEPHKKRSLHIACSNKQLEIVKLFLTNTKTDLNIYGKYHTTPLNIAYENEHIELFNLLLADQRTNPNTIIYSCGSVLTN